MVTNDVNEVSNRDFVKKWVAAYKEEIGLKGLVNANGWDYTATSARATKLRRAKVALPTMKAAKVKNSSLEVNPEPLNKIITDELGEEALHWRYR